MKKTAAIIIAGIMLCTTVVTAFGADIKKDDYQMVLDKLNEEYSTDVHFATKNEPAPYFNSSLMEITPEEFEQYIRKMIVENKKANEEAEACVKILKTKEICGKGEGICGQLSGRKPEGSSIVD